MFKNLIKLFTEPYQLTDSSQMYDSIAPLPPPQALTATVESSEPEEEPFRFTIEDMRDCLYNEDGSPNLEAAHDLAIYLIDLIDWTVRCLDTDCHFVGRVSPKADEKAWNMGIIPKLWLWSMSRAYTEYPNSHITTKYELKPIMNFYASAPDLIRESIGDFVGKLKRKVYT